MTGQVTFSVADLPQVPFETFNVHLFASDRGLLATPTHCTLYNVDSTFSPWNNHLAPQPSEPDPQPQLRARAANRAPGQVRPFNPRLVAGMSNATAGAFSDFHLKLDRDDGDQFLRRPQLQDAARVHRLPARDHLLPGGGDRRGRAEPGPRRAGEPELPGARARSAPRTSPPARAPRPSMRSARCTSPGRSRALR